MYKSHTTRACMKHTLNQLLTVIRFTLHTLTHWLKDPRRAIQTTNHSGAPVPLKRTTWRAHVLHRLPPSPRLFTLSWRTQKFSREPNQQLQLDGIRRTRMISHAMEVAYVKATTTTSLKPHHNTPRQATSIMSRTRTLCGNQPMVAHNTSYHSPTLVCTRETHTHQWFNKVLVSLCIGNNVNTQIFCAMRLNVFDQVSVLPEKNRAE